MIQIVKLNACPDKVLKNPTSTPKIKSNYQILVYAISIWIMADGLSAMLLVYPPNVWFIIRLIRILIGAILLLEARHVRTRLLIRGLLKDRTQKRALAYMDLLDFVGIWLIVDGIGTGLLNYVYPILMWQLLRLARIIIGAGLGFGSHFLWFKKPLSQPTIKELDQKPVAHSP